MTLVAHLGDIKNGSSVCSDDYFNTIRSDFDLFRDPFVYTPGDNEWTDCHRANNGGYVPTERLDKVRQVFFPVPGRTLGVHPKGVATQAADRKYAPYVVDGSAAAADYLKLTVNPATPEIFSWTRVFY